MSREQDAKVAEILGWAKLSAFDGKIWEAPDGHWYEVPEFTTDPSADYKVLEWVRNVLDTLPQGAWADRQGAWIDAYQEIIMDDIDRDELSMHALLRYQPGDYSRALLTLKEKGII